MYLCKAWGNNMDNEANEGDEGYENYVGKEGEIKKEVESKRKMYRGKMFRGGHSCGMAGKIKVNAKKRLITSNTITRCV